MSDTGLPGSTFTPTATAATLTRSALTGSVERTRIPWFARPISVSAIVAATSVSTPVVPPVILLVRISVFGLKVRTASFLTLSATSLSTTIPDEPGEAMNPSSPPDNVSPLTRTPAAPRSTRTPACASRTVRSRSSTSRPPMATPATFDPSIVEPVTVTRSVDFSTTTPRRPSVIWMPSSTIWFDPTLVNTPIG